MLESLKTALRWTTWPALMVGFIASYAWTQAAGLNPALSILGITVVHIAIIALIETVIPARRDWAWWSDRQLFNDIVHSLLLDVGVRLGNAALALGAVAFAASFATTGASNWWSGDWPFLGQLALAILINDFCDYWKHRAYHAWRWVWPVHFVHHDANRMHVLKAGRLHFLEAAIRTALVSAPLVVMGAPAEILFWLAAFANAFGGQNHWNVDARLPRWVHWVLATPHVHWVHHDKVFYGQGANFSSFSMLFDHVFGTFRNPVTAPVGDVGVAGEQASGHVLAQLMRPFLAPHRDR